MSAQSCPDPGPEKSEVLSIVKYLAEKKPAFLLSEVRICLDSPANTGDLYEMIGPDLPALGLRAGRRGDDYILSKETHSDTLILTEHEVHKVRAFLAAPRLPVGIENLVFRYIEKKVQKPWDDPVVLERVRRAIVYQKGRYWDERAGIGISYGKAYRIFGYLAYHLPVYFIQTEHLFFELAQAGLLKREMKVLDIGSGPGVVPLALTDFYRRLEPGRVKVTVNAIERDEEHREAYRFLVPAYANGVKGLSIHSPVREDIRSLSPGDIPEETDLMVFSNVLNELRELDRDEKAEIVLGLARNLSPHGSILIVEPADRTNSTEMRQLVVTLKERGLTVHSPCSFLWGTGCRPTECWSFEEITPIRPTRFMNALAACDEPFRYTNTDIKFSYAVLRQDSLVRFAFRIPGHAKYARLSSLRRHVGRRIHIAAAVMSRDLGDSTHHIVKLCDGTVTTPVFAVLPHYHRSRSNNALMTVQYGDIVAIRNVLVRFNEKENAFNLLVTRDTRVELVAGGFEGRKDKNRDRVIR